MGNEVKLDDFNAEVEGFKDVTLQEFDVTLSKVSFMQGESIGKLNQVIDILEVIKVLESVEAHGYLLDYVKCCIKLLGEVKKIEGIE